MAKASADELRKVILQFVPSDGASIGNQALYDQVQRGARAAKLGFSDTAYESAREGLIEDGTLLRGKGRGGSVHLAKPNGGDGAFKLDHVAERSAAYEATPPKSASRLQKAGPKAKAAPGEESGQVLSYRHMDKRKNNPEVGLVNEKNQPPEPKTEWKYDPHLDPALQFDVGRAQVEKLIDAALASGDQATMANALAELKRLGEPYLQWTGKAERTSFEVDTVSLHVHERIDPMSILAAVRKRMDDAKAGKAPAGQMGLFSAPFENLPLRDAIDFYRHERGWSNRLVLGDSLLVMNSLLRKESMAGQVQMIYIDPPYGIKYGSNFQPFTNKRDVKDRKDEDLTQEPEMIKAFRDTWELGIHSYLAYLRDRLLLAKELLHDSGSVFVQISDENLHHVRELLDEVFGPSQFIGVVTFKKTTGAGSPSGGTETLASVNDYLVWYAKRRDKLKYRQLYREKALGGAGGGQYTYMEREDGHRGRGGADGLGDRETDRPFRADQLTSQSSGGPQFFEFELSGRRFSPRVSGWKTTSLGMSRLMCARRIIAIGDTPSYVRFLDDFPAFPINNLWEDTVTSGFADPKMYVVQTNARVVERCMLMTTDPGDLVLDPTCGSGTTAFVAEKQGRRWITTDTSRVAVALTKQRLMTASFDYFELRYPQEGLRGGFIYKTVPHVTLKSIANNPQIDEVYGRMHPAIEAALHELNAALKRNTPVEQFTVTDGGRKGQALNLGSNGTDTLPTGAKVSAGELLEWEVPFDYPNGWPTQARNTFDTFHTARQAMQRAIDASIAASAESEQLYDQPEKSKTKLRISGPFTVEAVPFPSVVAIDEVRPPEEADAAIARSGESSRQHTWRDELLKTGIRGKNRQVLKFASLEPMAGTQSLHCSGTLDSGERVVVSFGPEHAALEQRQVEHALNEAEHLRPSPKFIVFCAFTFDPEAAKDIDETNWAGVTLLKAQMNTDLLTDDLKKARSSNESFWLMGQPEVEVRSRKDGRHEVEVHGFDYFDTVKGELISGGKGKIAMWMLDSDYDNRSLFPRQVFFPMAGKDEGWKKLKASIRAELDESALEKFTGTVSLPFERGEHGRVAVKIIDDRGIESLKIVTLGGQR
jgi:adenine-specific DNA-methyltransferase